MDLKTYVSAEHGAQTRLAKQINAQPQLVWQWANGVKPVPADRCASIERASGGQVPCEVMRPDLIWVRVPDAEWVWHTEGRPLLDLAADKSASMQQAASHESSAARSLHQVCSDRTQCQHEQQVVEGTLCTSTALPMERQADGGLRCAACGQGEAIASVEAKAA